MSIPICILNSNNSEIISNKTIQFHQNLAKNLKKKINMQKKKNSSQKENDFKSIITLPTVENSKIIFQWFSNLSLKERVIICSIHNKWLATLINQLIIAYNYNKECTFSPIGDFKDFFDDIESEISNIFINGNNYTISNYKERNDKDMNFFTCFLKYGSKIEYKIKEQYKYNERFLENLKFFSYEQPNDTISISKYFLSRIDDFKRYCELYTENNFLKCTIEFHETINKFYYYKFPKWLSLKKYFNIFEIIVGYIEQNIILNYEYYYYTKKIYENKLLEKINEVEELNLKLEKFLLHEYPNRDLLFSSFTNYEMKKNIQENPLLLIEFHYQKIINSKIFSIINDIDFDIMDSITESMLNHARERMKYYSNKSISEFLYNLTFVSSDDIISYDRPFFVFMIHYITHLFEDKNVNELIEDMHNQTNKKKKHKKKKKKNEKNNDNKDDNIYNDIKNDDKNINDLINIVDKKDDKEINIIEKNINHEKELNIINFDIENIIDNENEDNKKKKKGKNKKQKKEFFLYPTNNSKKKKEEHKENEQKNEIEKPNLINKNIKGIEINKEKVLLTSNSSQTDNSTIETSEEYSNNIFKNNKILYMNNNQYNYFYNPYYISQIHDFNILKNICFFKPSENFFTKLTLELEIYNSNVNNNISKLNPIKEIHIEKLDKMLKNTLTNFYNIEIINFGSYKTELSIEGSDIDILIKYKPIQNQNTFVSDLIGILYQNKQEFDYIKPITTASVPVIKLQFDISKLININKIDDYLDYDDLNKLKFDISFKEFDFYNNYFDKTIEFIKKSIFDFPYVKDIVLLMKRYFKIIKLNKNYLGGLSSYSIFIMTLAFLKSKNYSKDISIGKQFYYFIEWYSLFNFTEYIINVTKDNPFIKIDKFIMNDKITIIDPINQSNVSKSSFKIEEIKNAFIKVLNIIKIDAWKIEQEKEIDMNNINNPLKILNTIFQIK